jgi:hypothetical protein
MQAAGKGMDGPVCGARCKLETGGGKEQGGRGSGSCEKASVCDLGGRQGAYSDVEPIIEWGCRRQIRQEDGTGGPERSRVYTELVAETMCGQMAQKRKRDAVRVRARIRQRRLTS